MRDTLFRDAVVERRAELPVLGVPTLFETDDPRLLEAVETTFGGWRPVADHPELLQERTVRVRLFLHDDDPADAPRARVRYRMPDGGRLLLGTPGSTGVSDRDRAEAVAYVTPTLLEDGAHFRYAVLSALTLFLVTARDRTPLHAAAIMNGRRALLLHGPSGVGKSTLALAAVRRGLQLLSEDVVYVQREPIFRLWGNPGPLHVPADSGAFFPDIARGKPVVRAAGREKLAVEVAGPCGPDAAGGEARLPVAERAGICLLHSSKGPPRLEDASPEAVADVLVNPRESGFDLAGYELEKVADTLLEAGAWHLHVGDDPRPAAELLEKLIAGDARSAP